MLSRRLLLTSSFLVPLLALFPAASKVAGDVEHFPQLTGGEAFTGWKVEVQLTAAEQAAVIRELNARGRSKEVVATLIAQDFRDGRICEVRGVLLSHTECVLLSPLE